MPSGSNRLKLANVSLIVFLFLVGTQTQSVKAVVKANILALHQTTEVAYREQLVFATILTHK